MLKCRPQTESEILTPSATPGGGAGGTGNTGGTVNTGGTGGTGGIGGGGGFGGPIRNAVQVGAAGIPGVTIVPSSGRCFHGNVVHLFMAVANGFKGTFKWVYGTHVFTGGAIVAGTPDFLNQPQSITVTFTPDGGGPPSSATVALSYCAFAGNGTGGGLGAAEYGSGTPCWRARALWWSTPSAG